METLAQIGIDVQRDYIRDNIRKCVMHEDIYKDELLTLLKVSWGAINALDEVRSYIDENYLSSIDSIDSIIEKHLFDEQKFES